MTKTVVALFIAAALVTTSSVNAFASAPRSCTSTGYTQNCGGCVTLKATGHFVLKLPKTKVMFKGSESSSTKGTKICLTRVSAPKSSLGGVGLKVTAHGKFAPLHLKHGKLYLFNHAKNTVTKVTSVKSSGIYQVVGA